MTASPFMLQGLKILDLTRLLPGPFATRLLADWGADVIKVEDPQGGDYARAIPPLLHGLGVHFLQVNSNKRSLALDLKNDAGRRVIRRLLTTHDTLIEGFRPGVMARLGLDYEDLKADFPRLIYASLTGYGRQSPYRLRAGHDANYLALSGALSLTGLPDGSLAIPGSQVADITAALYLAFSVAAAAYGREHSGAGGFIDLAIADAAQTVLAMPFGEYAASGRAPGPADQLVSGCYVNYRIYRTADGGAMSLAALEPKFWHNFCEAVDKPHLLDEAYARNQPDNPVNQELEEMFASRTRAEWTTLFAAADCCCEPVLTLDEAPTHPHFAARRATRKATHPTAGTYRQINTPFIGQPYEQAAYRPAPQLGEHNEEILGELGYTRAEIDELAKLGAFG